MIEIKLSPHQTTTHIHLSCFDLPDYTLNTLKRMCPELHAQPMGRKSRSGPFLTIIDLPRDAALTIATLRLLNGGDFKQEIIGAASGIKEISHNEHRAQPHPRTLVL